MRALPLTVSTVVVGFGLTLLAPAASAVSAPDAPSPVTITVRVDCAADFAANPPVVRHAAVARPGDTVVLDWTDCAGWTGGPGWSIDVGDFGGSVMHVLPTAPLGTYDEFEDFFFYVGSTPVRVGTLDLTIAETLPSAGGAAGGPAPSYQQVPLPASGSCADVRDADLAYGTGLTGGWTRQWGEWADGGRGAVVCGRTIAWVDGAWSIQAP